MCPHTLLLFTDERHFQENAGRRARGFSATRRSRLYRYKIMITIGTRRPRLAA